MSQIVHPKDVATVTLGSSEIVTLVGGPQPWILDSSGFYESREPFSIFQFKESVLVLSVIQNSLQDYLCEYQKNIHCKVFIKENVWGIDSTFRPCSGTPCFILLLVTDFM